jgi:hypothetical protein
VELQYNLHELEKEFFDAIEDLKKLNFIDSEAYLATAQKNGKSILCEGAQGSLLDVDFGTYPFVTSSNTTAAGACTGLGIAPNKIKEVFGIFKAYTTRVGSGPFPTEDFDEAGDIMAKVGNEFGSVTGRKRRCGWLDLVALKYAIQINGVTQLIMMKGDVLSGFDTLKVANNTFLSLGKMPFFLITILFLILYIIYLIIMFIIPPTGIATLFIPIREMLMSIPPLQELKDKGVFDLYNSTGGTVSITGFTGFVTGGTYNNVSGTLTLNNSDGSSFQVTGFTSGVASPLTVSDGTTSVPNVSGLTFSGIINPE